MTTSSVSSRLLASALSALAAASVSAAPSFTQSVFATAPAGASGPDSVTVAAGSVWVAYDGNALSSDGSLPQGTSLVARYDPANGALQSAYSVAGDVDGLKYDAATGMMWATQNQDANSSVTLINTSSNATTPVHYAVTSSTQGIDDLVFAPQGTFLSMTNPSSPTDATLVQVVPGSSPIQVTTVATAGQAGLNIATGAQNYVPGVVNTDSLKLAPNGDLVQTTGNRDTLLFIHNAGLPGTSFSYLTLHSAAGTVTGLDDSLYLTSSSGRIFAAASNTDQLFEIDYSGVTPGTLVASIGSLKEIGFVDPETGNVTPFVTGLSGIHGLDVIAAVPEPSTWALMLLGCLGIGLTQRRKG